MEVKMFIRKSEYNEMVNKLKFYNEMLSDVAMLFSKNEPNTSYLGYDSFMSEQYVLLKIREMKEEDRLIKLAEDVEDGRKLKEKQNENLHSS
jgi:hypothetical protein